MFKKIFFGLIIGILTLSFQNVYAAGLVPCGGPEDPCTICHLLVGIKGIIDFLRNSLVIVGLFVIMVAGIFYLVSAGDSGLISKAKAAIKGAVAGIVVVLGAWLIVVFVLTLISAKDMGGDGVSLTKTGAWSFECSTKSRIGGDGSGDYDDQFIGDQDRDGVKDQDDNCPGSYNADQKDSDGDGVGDVCEQQEPIPDGAACGSGINSERKPSEDTLCTLGEPKNFQLSGGKWIWTCRYEDNDGNITSASCSTRGKVDLAGSGYTFDPGISIQQKDASEELQSLLECMDKAGLSQSARRISSISDTYNGKSVYDQCSKNWNDPVCDHKKNSCHYGGENCKDKGSMAVDFGNEKAYDEINRLANACGASYVLNEGNHIHVSVGGKYNCGCN